MRVWLLLLLVAGVARAQIEDEPTPAARTPTAPPPTVTPTAPPPPMTPPPMMRPTGIDVVLRLARGTEFVGRLLQGDAETVTIQTRAMQVVTLPRNEIREVWLAVIPTPETERERVGARRLKLAGLGLMISGGVCELLVALLWGAAVPISDANYGSNRSNVLIGAGAADVAFGIVGAQLLVMGGVMYGAGRGDERRYSAAGFSWRF
jgi:hypothetical protein